MRKAPDLDAMYGSVQPPRAKPGRASGIQAAERSKDDGMVKIHPARIILNPNLTPDLPQLLDAVRRELRDGAVFKWTVARNGAVMLAPYKLSERTKTLLLEQSKTACDTELPAGQSALFDKIKLAFEKSELPVGRKLPLGHPTLVGGLGEPEARMGGELHYGKLHEDDAEPAFYINNDSGRYSEYADRNEEMLKNVAKHFGEIGFPVKEKWVEKAKKELINKPKV